MNKLKTSYILCMFLLLIMAYFIKLYNKSIDNYDKKEPEEEKNKKIWIDYLKVISSYFIVVIHISGGIYKSLFSGNKWHWCFALMQQVLPRFAVPCFMMISGLLILSSNDISYEKVFQRIRRIVIPLIFWSLMHILWSLIVDKISIIESIHSIIQIPFHHIKDHLWYPYMLVWFYLLSPFLYYAYESTDKKIIFATIMFVLIIPGFVDIIIRIFDIDVPTVLPVQWFRVGPGEIALLMLGKLLFDTINTKTEIIKKICFYGMISSILLMMVCSVITSIKNDKPDFSFFEHLRLPDVFYGVFVFLFFSLCLNKKLVSSHLISSISSVSLGIYMSHVLCGYFLFKEKLIPSILFSSVASEYPVIFCFIDAFVIYFFTILICSFISKIPYLSKVVR